MGRKNRGSSKKGRGKNAPVAAASERDGNTYSGASRKASRKSGAHKSDPGGGANDHVDTANELVATTSVAELLEEAVTQTQTRRADLRMDGYRTLVRLLQTNCLEEVHDTNLVPRLLRSALSSLKKRTGEELRLTIKVLSCVSVIIASIDDDGQFFSDIFGAATTRIKRWQAAEKKDREDRLRGAAADGRDAVDEASSSDTEIIKDMVFLLGYTCFVNENEASQSYACVKLLESLFSPHVAALKQWEVDEEIATVIRGPDSVGGRKFDAPNKYDWDAQLVAEYGEDYGYGADSTDDEAQFDESSPDGGKTSEDSQSESDSAELQRYRSNSSKVGTSADSEKSYDYLLTGSNPVVVAAISSWAMLLTTAAIESPTAAHSQEILRRLAFWLNHNDVGVKIAAAKCIGILYERFGSLLIDETMTSIEDHENDVSNDVVNITDANEEETIVCHGSTPNFEDDVSAGLSPEVKSTITSKSSSKEFDHSLKFNVELEENANPQKVHSEAAIANEAPQIDWLSIVRGMLGAQPYESVRRRKREDRKVYRRVFSDLTSTLNGDGFIRENIVELNLFDTIVIDSWSTLIRYDMFCIALGNGISNHVREPQSVLHKIFRVQATRAKLTKEEKQIKRKGKASVRWNRRVAASVKYQQ